MKDYSLVSVNDSAEKNTATSWKQHTCGLFRSLKMGCVLQAFLDLLKRNVTEWLENLRFYQKKYLK